MSFLKFMKKEKPIETTNCKYKEGQEVRIILGTIPTKVTILKVFNNTAIVKSKEGECKTCMLSEILD